MELGSIFRSNTFKFIYFWEYLHRLWARSMGFVFLFPFMFFYFKKWIPRSLIRRLGLVILLAVLAATFGWIMVASGLVNRPWVNAYKLSLHLCIGISVFAALWWAFISYIHPRSGSGRVSSSKKYLRPLLFLLIVQIFLGGVMSGTKAALFINTWPDLNGEMIPSDLLNLDIPSFVNTVTSSFCCLHHSCILHCNHVKTAILYDGFHTSQELYLFYCSTGATSSRGHPNID